MINWKSILSAFCDKPTLVQWLCKVEKALKESVLEQIKPIQNTDKTTLVLSFIFADGTTIETPEITLPQGPQGVKGTDGVSVTSVESQEGGTTPDRTITALTFNMSDDKKLTVPVYAKNGTNGTDGAPGTNGTDGVSITGVDEVSDEVVGDQTLTTLRFHKSNGENDEVVVYAKNGTDGKGSKLFRHDVDLTVPNNGRQIHVLFPVYSTDGSVYTTVAELINALNASGLSVHLPASSYDVLIVDLELTTGYVYLKYADTPTLGTVGTASAAASSVNITDAVFEV